MLSQKIEKVLFKPHSPLGTSQSCKGWSMTFPSSLVIQNLNRTVWKERWEGFAHTNNVMVRIIALCTPSPCGWLSAVFCWCCIRRCSPTFSIYLKYCSLKNDIISSISMTAFITQSVNEAPLAALQTLSTGKNLMNARWRCAGLMSSNQSKYCLFNHVTVHPYTIIQLETVLKHNPLNDCAIDINGSSFRIFPCHQK